jgi:predicted amidophosphoribosyltransferase
MYPAKPHTIYGVHERWSWSILLSLALLFDVPCVRAQSTTSESLAEINGETITTEELNRALGARLSQLEEQIYNLKSRELDALIAQCLLAQETARLRDALGELTVTPGSTRLAPIPASPWRCSSRGFETLSKIGQSSN